MSCGSDTLTSNLLADCKAAEVALDTAVRRPDRCTKRGHTVD
jgi:hypothetical protein